MSYIPHLAIIAQLTVGTIVIISFIFPPKTIKWCTGVMTAKRKNQSFCFTAKSLKTE